MMQPTEFQKRILEMPEQWSLFLGGSRGGGKSVAVAFLVLRHCEKYKADAHPLIIREGAKAISEMENLLEGLFTSVYGLGVKLNRADHVIRLPNGAIVELGYLEGPSSYLKFHGRSFTLLVIEEYAALKNRTWAEMLKSGLRTPADIPLRTILTGNPGGMLSAYVHKTYILPQRPWINFEVDGETWANCPSQISDNKFLPENYRRTLMAACGNDKALFDAWCNGNWAIERGAYFGDVLDQDVHQLRAEWPYRVTPAWRGFCAMDWGSSAPTLMYICLRAPGGQGPFPRDSLILVDELAVVDSTDLNVGLKWPIPKLAEAIKDLAKEWNVFPGGVSDDAYGMDQSLLNALHQMGCHFQRPTKARVSGWQKMRTMLHNAAERNGQPGLWISARCEYFWQTVPYLERDPLRPEDMVTKGPDHAADSCRYACYFVDNYARSGSLGLGGIW